MKKLLFILILLGYNHISNAQCTVEATNFGNNTNAFYEVVGDINVTLNTNNTVTVDLASNFSTGSGPDIRLYLINSNGATTSQIQNSKIEDLEHIVLGLVGCTQCNPVIPANGAKSFTASIPSNVNIEDFDKVFFYCLQFDAFWDFGNIIPFSTSNCSVLSTNDKTFLNFSISPNPTKNTIKITSPQNESALIEIHNVLGKKVFQETSVLNTTLNISHLKAGIYIISINTNGRTSSKKLIIN